MGTVVCPSPRLLDQSFPRDLNDLQTVGIALEELNQGLTDGRWSLILVDVFEVFLETFDWQKSEDFTLLRDIYNIVSNWFLRSNGDVIRVDVSTELLDFAHPIPAGSTPSPGVDFWAEQVGKLLILHNRLSEGEPFIGVACDRAFSGEPIGYYLPPQAAIPVFPLVSPKGAEDLGDVYDWELENDLDRKSVSFSEAKRNLPILKGVVKKPSGGGSHFIVTFPNGKRPFVLDRNHDPQPDEHLKEIVPMVNLPFRVIKQTLLNGEMPERSSKLAPWTL